MINEIPRGINIRPSIPLKKNRGTKLTIMMSVELSIGIRTSLDASKITSIGRLRSFSGNRRFSRNRLYTFSTSTIASSTREPIAIAIPPRLIVFIVSPIKWRVSIDTNKERGKATKDITVVLKFIKKKNKTIMTKTEPSNRDFCMLSIELSIKRDCRNTSVEMWISAGKFFCNSATDWSSFSVSSSVLVFGCLVTVINTAGSPFSEAIPSLGALFPIWMSAMSSSRTGMPFIVFTTALDSSSIWFVETIPLTIYSLLNSYNIPPFAFWFIFRVVFMTSFSPMP